MNGSAAPFRPRNHLPIVRRNAGIARRGNFRADRRKYCGSELDLVHPQVRLVAEHAETAEALTLPLGTVGVLAKMPWTVIGYLERSDGSSAWGEYLLFSPVLRVPLAHLSGRRVEPRYAADDPARIAALYRNKWTARSSPNAFARRPTRSTSCSAIFTGTSARATGCTGTAKSQASACSRARLPATNTNGGLRNGYLRAKFPMLSGSTIRDSILRKTSTRWRTSPILIRAMIRPAGRW